MIKICIFLLCNPDFARQTVPHEINLKNGKTFNLNLRRLRNNSCRRRIKGVRFFQNHLTDGFRTYIDLRGSRKGAVILDEWNAETGKLRQSYDWFTNWEIRTARRFKRTRRTRLFISGNRQWRAAKFTKERRSGPIETANLATFPLRLSYKYGGWHWPNNRVFAERQTLGFGWSSCNACVEKEAIRATFWKWTRTAEDREIMPRLRNAVALNDWEILLRQSRRRPLGTRQTGRNFYALKAARIRLGWVLSIQRQSVADSQNPRPQDAKSSSVYAYFRTLVRLGLIILTRRREEW